MGWFNRTLPCLVCDRSFPKKALVLGVDRKGYAVCPNCLCRWWSDGRACLRCGQRVAGNQDIAYFEDLHGFGHYDCGGIRLAHHDCGCEPQAGCQAPPEKSSCDAA